jgi:hypothetical protein
MGGWILFSRTHPAQCGGTCHNPSAWEAEAEFLFGEIKGLNFIDNEQNPQMAKKN